MGNDGTFCVCSNSRSEHGLHTVQNDFRNLAGGSTGPEGSSLDRVITSFLPKKEHIFVSVSGSGGKTSVLQLLGDFYKKAGFSVLLTTTTKFQHPQFYSWRADRFVFTEKEAFSRSPEKGKVVVYGEKGPYEKKLVSPAIETLEKLKDLYDVVLSESDGSRGLPLKIHTSRDPVIPDFSNYTVCVLGAAAIGKKCSETVFGYDSGNSRSNSSWDIVSAGFLQEEIIGSPEGLFKGTKAGGRLVLLNGFELLSDGQRKTYRALSYPDDVPVLGGFVMKNSLIERLR